MKSKNETLSFLHEKSSIASAALTVDPFKPASPSHDWVRAAPARPTATIAARLKREAAAGPKTLPAVLPAKKPANACPNVQQLAAAKQQDCI